MLTRCAIGSGYEYVESDVFCVLTRFRVRSMWSVVRFFFLSKAVQREISQSPIKGLLSSSFLIEDLHTCYTMSFWSSQESVGSFNALVRSHIDAANAAIPLLSLDKDGRPELWSAQLRLDAVSPHNLRWDGWSVPKGVAQQARRTAGAERTTHA